MKTQTFNFHRKVISKIALWLLLASCLFPARSFSQTWSSLPGGGMNDWVYASVVYNGDLIVGGKFTAAGGVSANHIARWDGTAWSPLGLGVNAKVWALIVHNGLLYVGGEFTEAGGIPMNFIAIWDGTSWLNDLGDMGSIVTSFAIYNNRLIVGGYFTDADGVPLNYVAQYGNNGWEGLGTGVVGTQGQVMAMDVYNNELIVGGFFTAAGGVSANHVAKWNGTSWSALGSGISNIVYSFTNYNGNLIAGGLFLSAGGVPANHIASWNGSSWSALGGGMSGIFYQYVLTLGVYKGNLIAGGYFTHSDGIQTNGIATWNGSAWSSMGGGLFYPGNVYGAHTLCVYGQDLVVGGLFSSAGSQGNTSHLALWNVSNNVTLNSTMFIEGHYSGGGFMDNQGLGGCLYVTGMSFSPTDDDTVFISAMNSLPPYNEIDRQAGILQTDGTVNVTFGNPVLSGHSYYIRVQHRNAVETWSSTPVLMAALTTYDFTAAQSMAYGNNLIQTPDLMGWAFFSGDVFDAVSGQIGRQDGIIESGDFGAVENSSAVLLSGYVSEDITGDGLVESADYSLIENNAVSLVFSMHP